MSQKKVQRTQELKLASERQLLTEVAQNDIEEHNFQKLIKSGIIVLQKNEQ